MNLQPIATLFFGEGWSIGYSGNILADWTAPSEDVWTVPVGLGLAKVVKLGRLPVKVQLAVQYMPIHPRISGQEWNVQISITPVIPEAYQGRLVPVTRRISATTPIGEYVLISPCFTRQAGIPRQLRGPVCQSHD